MLVRQVRGQGRQTKGPQAPAVERDRTIKLDLYAQHGVKEYWIVDPDAGTVTVLLRGEGSFEVGGICGEGETLRSPTLAGFGVDLVERF